MKDNQIRRLTMGGVMAALVFVMTYLPKVPVLSGYVHLGDGAVFLAAMLLGPTGAAAAALGSALADLVGGYMAYLLPTFAIKGAMALLVWKAYRGGAWLRNAVVFLAAEAIMVGGYFAFEALLYGVPAALGGLFPNAMQGVAGIVLGLLSSALAPRLKATVK